MPFFLSRCCPGALELSVFHEEYPFPFLNVYLLICINYSDSLIFFYKTGETLSKAMNLCLNIFGKQFYCMC